MPSPTVVPHISASPDAWSAAVARMAEMLAALLAAPIIERPSSIPDGIGVYLFCEDSSPLYVGQSQTLQRRYCQHTQPARHHNEATFAFQLAVEEAARLGVPTNGTREQIEARPDFSLVFKQAKARVKKMQFRALEHADPIERTMFEIYATLHLGTRYNSFETH